jgi:hypothetical protein
MNQEEKLKEIAKGLAVIKEQITCLEKSIERFNRQGVEGVKDQPKSKDQIRLMPPSGIAG